MQASATVPLPIKGSKTISPSLDVISINGFIKDKGKDA